MPASISSLVDRSPIAQLIFHSAAIQRSGGLRWLDGAVGVAKPRGCSNYVCVVRYGESGIEIAGCGHRMRQEVRKRKEVGAHCSVTFYRWASVSLVTLLVVAELARKIIPPNFFIAFRRQMISVKPIWYNTQLKIVNYCKRTLTLMIFD